MISFFKSWCCCLSPREVQTPSLTNQEQELKVIYRTDDTKNIPEEIFRLILSPLDDSSLKICHRVSRSWQQSSQTIYERRKFQFTDLKCHLLSLYILDETSEFSKIEIENTQTKKNKKAKKEENFVDRFHKKYASFEVDQLIEAIISHKNFYGKEHKLTNLEIEVKKQEQIDEMKLKSHEMLLTSHEFFQENVKACEEQHRKRLEVMINNFNDYSQSASEDVKNFATTLDDRNEDKQERVQALSLQKQGRLLDMENVVIQICKDMKLTTEYSIKLENMRLKIKEYIFKIIKNQSPGLF